MLPGALSGGARQLLKSSLLGFEFIPVSTVHMSVVSLGPGMNKT